jgi:hypothetical protein
LKHFENVMSLHFVESDPDDFARFADTRTHGLSENAVELVLSKARPARGKYGSIDTAALIVSVITSATVAAVANGLISLVRDYLAHVLSTRELKRKNQLARTKIVVSVGDRRIEVERSSSETAWREMLTALRDELASQDNSTKVARSPRGRSGGRK